MPRAVHLLLADKAEIIESDGTQLHSQRSSFPTPVVVRLRYYVRVPYNLPMPLSRRAILLRDGFTCQYCGVQPGREHLTIDHIMPRSRGGRTDWENTVAACGACNRRKGNRTPEEASMQLLSIPARPRFWAMALMMTPGNDAWRKYLFMK